MIQPDDFRDWLHKMKGKDVSATRTLSKNDVGSLTARREFDGTTKIYQHPLQQPDGRSSLAFAFIERWGMVAAAPDGEDSAGRAKIRLATPEEVTDRAFECASLAWQRAVDLGWMLTMPTIEEIERTDNGGPDKEE